MSNAPSLDWLYEFVVWMNECVNVCAQLAVEEAEEATATTLCVVSPELLILDPSKAIAENLRHPDGTGGSG